MSTIMSTIKTALLSICVLALVLASTIVTLAGIGGSISSTVKDASGAAIPRAAVTRTNTGTGVQQPTTTDDHGSYSFLGLPVGHYDVEVARDGFKPYRRTDVVIDVNSTLVVD